MVRQINISTERELFKACQILFGVQVDVSRDFLFYIQPSGIKSAYRRMALETHPDRAATKGPMEQRRYSERFRQTMWAYEKLIEFVGHRDNGPRPVFATQRAAARPAPYTYRARSTRRPVSTPQSGPMFNGPMPKRPLLFGQFLYYSGQITWDTLIKAINWQRVQRPKLGDLALSSGLLNRHHIQSILMRRAIGEQIGQAMLRLKLLNHGQLSLLLANQKRLQQPLGEFFVKHNYIPRAKMTELLSIHRMHNFRHKNTAKSM